MYIQESMAVVRTGSRNSLTLEKCRMAIFHPQLSSLCLYLYTVYAYVQYVTNTILI